MTFCPSTPMPNAPDYHIPSYIAANAIYRGQRSAQASMQGIRHRVKIILQAPAEWREFFVQQHAQTWNTTKDTQQKRKLDKPWLHNPA